MTPEKIIQQARASAVNISREKLSRLSGEYLDFLDSYTKLLVSLDSMLTDAGAGQKDWRDVGNALIGHFDKIRQLIRNSAFEFEDIAKNASVSWYQEVETLLQAFPENIDLEIDDNLRHPQDDDTFDITIRKKLFILQSGSKNILDRMGSLGGRLFGREAKPVKVPRRTFSLHNFLRLHLGSPTVDIFLKQFQLLIGKMADNIRELHVITDSISDTLLPLTDLIPESPDQQSEIFTGNNPDVKKQIQLVAGLVDQINSWDKSLAELFESEISVIEKSALYRWESAGTIVYPERKFSGKTIIGQQERLDKQQDKITGNCRNLLQGQSGEWQKDLELSLLQFRCAQNHLETLSNLQEKAVVKIQAEITDAKDLIGGMKEQLSADQVTSDIEIFRAILNDAQKTIDILRHDKLPQIMDTVHQADIEQIYADYFSSAARAADMLSDSYLLFQAHDHSLPPPTSSLETVKLKPVVSDDLLTGIKDSHSGYLSEIQSSVQQAMRIVSEIDQIVEFNIEASTRYLTDYDGNDALEKAHQMAVDGIHRAEDRLGEVGEKFTEISDLADSSLKEITIDLLRKLQDLADTEKIFEIKIRLARSLAREKLRQTQRTIIRKIVSFGYLRSAFLKIYSQVSTGFKKAKDYTEIKQSDSSIDEQISTLLRESHQKVSHLPYVYQRLFSLAPLSDSRFFAGRTSELEMIAAEFETWKARGCISVAMVGERGSGKTTLLNFANSMVFKDFPMVNIELTRTINGESELVKLIGEAFGEPDVKSMDELERKLAESEEQRICVFENLHDLFLRTVDGFDALERFLLLIYKTQDRVFWVVTSGLYGWQYLDKVLKISNHFQHIIMLGTLSKEEVTEIITKRHRVSGYDLEIEVSEDFRQTKTYRKLATNEARQHYLMEQLFERLALFSSGNIRVAMQFWLATIKDFSGEKLTLSAAMDLKLDFVKQLPGKELFTIAALIQHEALSAEEHALVFRRDVNYSEILLDKMLNIGLLQKSSVGYQVHPFIYRTAVNALKEKNIFH